MKKQSYNWLVTGGCGFIGSNFIRLLLEQSESKKIVNLDALTYAGNLANLSDVKDERYLFVRGDICDEALVRRLLAEHKITHVVNFAAESHVDRSIIDTRNFIQTNVEGVRVLLEAVRNTGAIRFLQVSTDEVYGSLGADGKFHEELPLAPNSPYSASKASADLLIRAFVNTFHTDAVITRCSNNYGPYQFPEKLIPLMTLNALSDKPLPVYGDGRQIRDWIHVRDHCEGILYAVLKGKSGEAYNFGGNSEKENIEIVKLILHLVGKPESLIKHVTDRPGHDRRYAMDYTKAERELGWQPKVNFEKGIAETVKWYSTHPEWWKPILSGEYTEFYTKWYGNRLG